MSVLYAGLVVWLSTLIVTDSELFRPFREWLEVKRDEADVAWVYYTGGQDEAQDKSLRRRYDAWFKLHYFSECPLCMGTWIGIALAAVVPGPFSFFLLNGLLYKAVAHIILATQNTLERYS